MSASSELSTNDKSTAYSMEKFEFVKRSKTTATFSLKISRSRDSISSPGGASSTNSGADIAFEAISSAPVESPISSSDLNSNCIRVSSPLKRKTTSEETSEEKSDKKYRIDTTEKLLDIMECPVCLEVPRSAPIFSCRNGHLICGTCQPKLDCCPICRSTDVNIRNRFAEKFAVPLLAEASLPCINHSFGCQHKDLGKRLSLHAPNCLHDQVHCPASHRGACKWQGTLITVVSHASKSKCAQLLRVEDVPFRSSIGDFNDTDASIFQRTGVTHWKPVFLLSQSVVRYFLYLVIYREGNGQWYIYVRSLAHKELAKNVQVTIKLAEASPVEAEATTVAASENKNSPVFQFTGNVLSASMKEEDVLQTGNYLFLKDQQIKMLKRGKTLFEYSVTVNLRRQMPGNIEIVEPLHPKKQPQSLARRASRVVLPLEVKNENP